MNSGTFWLVFIVAVLVAGGGLVVQWQLHRRKVAEFAAFAARRGWRYTELDHTLAGRYLGAPFGRGFGRRAQHVLTGEYRRREIVAFEYTYKVREGSDNDRRTTTRRRTTTHRHMVVALGTPASRPTLEVGRAGLGRKLLGLVGIRDLQLESEEFNQAFHIRTDSDRFAYEVLHPRTMEWMLGDQRCRELPFRFERADLLTWLPGRIDLVSTVGMLEYLCDVLDRVPAFVWKD